MDKSNFVLEKSCSKRNHDAMDSAKQPKLKKKKPNSLKEKAKEMSEVDFMVEYLHIDGAINDLSSFENLTIDGKNMMRKYMAYVPKKELDDMENKLEEYHLQEIEGLKERILCFEKLSFVVQKAIKYFRSTQQS